MVILFARSAGPLPAVAVRAMPVTVRSPRTEIAVPRVVVFKDNEFSPAVAPVMMRFFMDLMAFSSLAERAFFPWRVTFPKTVMVISFSPVLVTLR